MKFMHEVSAEKLRGGFYTPPSLVAACYERIAALIGSGRALRILEPSAGDGSFLRGFGSSALAGPSAKPNFTCIELLKDEAAKCRGSMRSAGVGGTVTNDSFFSWAKGKEPVFDAVVGNPPFVRYQFVPKDQRTDADWLFTNFGKQFDGVSNLWIPVVLISLDLLRTDGAFSMVLPSELFATKSAGLVRSELIRHFENLQIDIYQRGSFPSLLQDVVVISGRRTLATTAARNVRFVEHTSGQRRSWTHRVSDSKEAWTRYLLTKGELAAYEAAAAIPNMHKLRDVATIGVSIVTGANDFFTLDDATLDEYDLHPWAQPLLARTNDSPGLCFRKSDHRKARASGRKAWILNFASGMQDPMQSEKPRRYLNHGESLGLPARYKCRIRSPWFRVPDVRHDRLMLSKRAHQFHRLLLNDASVNTTDTIYRGHMKEPHGEWSESLVASFHNSLTILSSEMEGRTYGGGVLELVPSEIGRLIVPLVDVRKELKKLDQLCRDAGGQQDADDTLITATDELLCRKFSEYRSLVGDLVSARKHLRNRRFFGSNAASTMSGDAVSAFGTSSTN